MLVSDENVHLAFSLSSNAISVIGMCTKGFKRRLLLYLALYN